MTVWTVIRTPTNLRFVLPILDGLRRRGHRVHVSVAVDGATADDERALAQLRREVPGASVVPLDLRDGSRLLEWYARTVVLPARELRSYLELAPHWPAVLRERWLLFLPRPLRGVVRLARRLPAARLVHRAAALRLLRGVEAAYPAPRALLAAARRIAPDVVLVSPLVYPGSREVDAVKAASELGVPACGLVLSWDNLSSKGSFHVLPERVLVWNDAQVEEARRLHGLDAHRLAAVGAPVFDYLFSSRLRLPRGDFLPALGLEPDERFVVYAVSSQIGLGAGGEVEIVRRLSAALAGAAAERVRVVVRPHPKNRAGWDGAEGPRVVVEPDPGFPDDDERRARLLNTLVHADAVVGLNTSVFLEAAIVGTPCVALRFPESHPAAAVSAFPHFRHVLDAGFLHLAADEREAASLIARIGELDAARAPLRRRFVERFIRPAGLDRPAAEVAADALCELAEARA